MEHEYFCGSGYYTAAALYPNSIILHDKDFSASVVNQVKSNCCESNKSKVEFKKSKLQKLSKNTK